MIPILSPAMVACPDCGAESPAQASFCWLCRRRLARPPEAPEDLAGRTAVGAEGHALRGSPHLPGHLSLPVVLLALTLLAILCGVALVAPGLAVVLAVLLVPPFLFVTLAVSRAKTQGRAVSTAEKGGYVLGTMGWILGVIGTTLAVIGVFAILTIVAIAAAIIGLFQSCLNLH